MLNPVFAVEDIARERRVILEEIKMDEDSPEYLVHEIFTQNFWKDHPLGKPILGTKETVKDLSSRRFWICISKRFTPGNFIISAAGNLNHERFVELVTKHFEHMKPLEERLPPLGAEDRPAHHAAQQEIARASADLHGCSVPSHRARKALRLLRAEHAAGGRNEFAAFPEYSRAPGAGVFDLQRFKSVSRYRMPVGIRGHFAAVGGEGGAVGGDRNSRS